MLRTSLELRSFWTALVSLALLTVIMFGVVGLSMGLAEISWRMR